MKRILVPALLTILATTALAHEGHDHIKNGKPISLNGEVVDLTCYMQHPENAVGADHMKCAKSCIAKGLPVGFLASNGTLYALIGPEHEPVTTQVADYLGKPSAISGTLVEHHGMKAIALASIGAAVAGAKEAVQPGGQPGKESSGKAGSTTPVTYYTCTMHPEIHQDHPGNCPKCGMKLVPEKKK